MAKRQVKLLKKLLAMSKAREARLNEELEASRSNIQGLET